MPFGSADCICFSILEIADAPRMVIDFKLSFLNLRRECACEYITQKRENKRKYRIALPIDQIQDTDTFNSIIETE